jgi:dihydrofolate reductase
MNDLFKEPLTKELTTSRRYGTMSNTTIFLIPNSPMNIIVAIAQNNVIGKDNQLIWHLPNDLKHFRKLTTGNTIIMGRKTYQSIGKPLPNRVNIIISRNKDFVAEGCIVVNSLTDALAHCTDQCFVIGGAEIYQQALPLATKIYLTEIHAQVEGDTFFPEIDKKIWQETSREDYETDEKHIFPYSFVELNHKL